MNVEQRVKEILILLTQISEDPDLVLSVMDELGQAALIKELDVIAKQAITIHSSIDMLNLVNSIYRIVEEQPDLRALLLPEETDVEDQSGQRNVTLADQLATTKLNTYIQERAPQIRNAVIMCRTQLETALQEKGEIEQKSDQGKSHDKPKH